VPRKATTPSPAHITCANLRNPRSLSFSLSRSPYQSVNKGSITAINPPDTIAGGLSLRVTIHNDSNRTWASSGPHPIFASYHWLNAEWNMVVFDGRRTELPTEGIPAGNRDEIEVRIDPPPEPGEYNLCLTLVEEGVGWFEFSDKFFAACDQVTFRDFGPDLVRRIEMTTRCRDCDYIPKHPDAGKVFEFEGKKIQVMHEGTKVLAGGYYGDWMEEIIANLRGHHEPQEELVFHHLLSRLSRRALMIELGSFWAYYSNWFLGVVPDSHAICIEPDENNLAIGRANVALNERQADFHLGCIGARHEERISFTRESDHKLVDVPRFDWPSVAGLAGQSFVDLLHIDAQGAEFPFLCSLPDEGCEHLLRFVVVSTHHASISGSATTHRDCLLELVRRGAVILSEHSVEESFSGDGLIVASFRAEDALSPLPSITKNNPENSQFGFDPTPQASPTSEAIGQTQVLSHPAALEQAALTATGHGQFWVLPSDTAIGASLLRDGSFEENTISEVAAFLAEKYAFTPKQFVDIGANIGTHLIYALHRGLFETGLAFEAEPLNYELLVRNIRQNGLESRARSFHYAISSRAGAVTLEQSADNFGDHRIRPPSRMVVTDAYNEAARSTISLVSEKLDNLDAEYQLGIGSNSLVWIDTQGHEGHVLEGAGRLVETGRIRYVVCELWPYGLERSGGKDKLFNFLSRCEAVYDLRAPNWQESAPLNLADLSTRYEELLSAGVGHTDLLCIA
jgi:FkbM family methyltransferase